MKYLFYLLAICLTITACNSNKEPEIKFIESSKSVLKNTPKYILSHPDAWIEKDFNSNSNSEHFDLSVKAYANVSYNYMMLPDSVNTDSYIQEMKKSIEDRNNLLVFNKNVKEGKEYSKIEYKLDDQQESICEQIVFVSKQEVYSLNFSYSKKLTPPGYVKQGREILNSFIVK